MGKGHSHNGLWNTYVTPHNLVATTLLVLFMLSMYKLGELRGTIHIVNTGELRGEPNVQAHPDIERLSWAPRAFLYHKFLTKEQCEYIISMASKDVTRSTVVGQNGKSVEDGARSSFGTFLHKYGSDPMVVAIEEKIANWVQIPETHGEIMYLLRYDIGQEYRPHMDWFPRDKDGEHWIGNQGQRIATVLMYLSEVEEGGETFFPDASGGEIQVKPRQGDALLFWDLTVDGEEDPLSRHGAKPVVRGVKYAMTKWIRQRPTRGWI